MTVIAAYHDGRDVVIASDTELTLGWSKEAGHPKLVQFKGGVAGLAGSVRALRVIRRTLNSSDVLEDEAHLDRLVSQVRSDLSAAGWNPDAGTDLPLCNDFSLLLVSWEGAIWRVFPDFSYLHSSDFAAIGSGAEVATGAMAAHAALRPRLPAGVAANAAIAAAMTFSKGCGGRPDSILVSRGGSRWTGIPRLVRDEMVGGGAPVDLRWARQSLQEVAPS